MDLLTACSCGLDPATETMALQTIIAAGVSVPFWFRGQIASAVGRLLGRGGTAGECTDTPEDQPRSDSPPIED